MNRISGIVIAKNEENMIADCLDSLSFCNEIIVIDGGSKDRTAEVAKRLGAEVFTYMSDDFSKIRNYGLSKAKGDWILYIDADERVDSSLKTAMTHLTGYSDRVQQLNAYFLKRKNFYFGNHEWPHIERLERLFKRNKLEGWYGKLHESPKIRGKVGDIDGYLLHYTHRDLSSMVNKTIEWSKIEADLLFKSGHPKMSWWRFPRVMLTVFFDYYIKQGGWKVGTAGLIESMYQSFSIFVTYARLWEVQEKLKTENEK